MSIDYRRGYSRGYQRGRMNSWPEFIPPAPPVDVVQRLLSAALDLRNAIDSELATFDPEDEMAQRLYVFQDRVTEQLEAVTEWVKQELAAVVQRIEHDGSNIDDARSNRASRVTQQ